MTVPEASLLLIIASLFTSVPHLSGWTIQYVIVQDSYGPLNFADLFGSSHTHLTTYTVYHGAHFHSPGCQLPIAAEPYLHSNQLLMHGCEFYCQMAHLGVLLFR